jgi:hypothetical protein
MKRKAVQMVTAGEKNVLIVLADDGTMWVRVNSRVEDGWKTEWRQLPTLPDDNSNLGRVTGLP